MSAVRICAQIDELTLCQLDANHRLLINEHSISHVQGRRLLAVCMLLCGSGDFTSGAERLELRAGSITIFVANEPFEIVLQQGASCLILTTHLSNLNDVGGTVKNALPATFSGATGPGLLLCSALRALPEAAQALDVASPSAAAVVSGIEQLVTATFTHERKDRFAGASAARVDQIKSYVLAHLREPDLSVHRIADSLYMSASTVHRAFSGEACSVISWIWSMRLDGARRDLCDQSKNRRSITEVAFSWGFNDTAHFSRSFRSRFGHSPRDQRSNCLSEDSTDATD